MPLQEFMPTVSFVAAAIGILTSGLSAAWSFVEKAKNAVRTRIESRQKEIIRLQGCLKQVQPIFSEIFDLQSSRDEDLRLNNLKLTEAEVSTRLLVDQAFEHLRDLHRSVRFGLINKEDLAPWVYWIYRVQTRKPIEQYAKACGYMAFMDDLASWIQESKEIQIIKDNCPWL